MDAVGKQETGMVVRIIGGSVGEAGKGGGVCGGPIHLASREGQGLCCIRDDDRTVASRGKVMRVPVCSAMKWNMWMCF